MKILHRLSFNADSALQEQLGELDIKVGQGHTTIIMDESDPRWPAVQSILLPDRAGNIVSTEFTAAELKSAAYLHMVPSWHHGYPQPEDDFGYRAASYDLSDYCPECGVGKHQVAPIRLKGEPRWGRKHILKVNWIFDEFFVRPEVWESTFRPFGVGCRAVVKHRTGEELKTIVQLDVAATAASALRGAEELTYKVCQQCGRRKYLLITRGPFPQFSEEPQDAMFKTQEYFGSGASAWNAIIVSSELFLRITEQKLKGVKFKPCLPRPPEIA